MDGGMATQLEAKGIQLHSELWSAYELISHPEFIEDIHYAYLESGANIITTNSYQVSLLGFKKIGLEEGAVKELLRKSVDLAVSAKERYLKNTASPQRPIFVAGSVGPYGAHLNDGSEYKGEYAAALSEQEIIEYHLPRIEVFLNHPGVDIILCETFPSLREASVLVSAISTLTPKKPIFVSFTVKHVGDSLLISNGEDFFDAFKVFEQFEQVLAIGVNCVSSLVVSDLLDLIKKRGILNKSTKKIIVYPNVYAWNATTKTWIISQAPSTSPEELVSSWFDSGASIIGGCCSTGPQHIHLFSQILKLKLSNQNQ
uniref:Hcy-binding domain-containing protein n=1 Tax=Arcella intermedia TaxID=1963864 RepID=A0A6B2LAG7_9EUKA